MIIKGPKELLPTYFSQRQQHLKAKHRMSLQLTKHHEPSSEYLRKGSHTLLDQKKIKSRLSQLLNDGKTFKRADSQILQSCKQTKYNYKQGFNKTFLKKKKKSGTLNSLMKQRMQILQEKKKIENKDPPFQIKQIKVLRKGSPLSFNFPKQIDNQFYIQRYCKVLRYSKGKYSKQKILRKTAVPQNLKISQNKYIQNNFVKRKQKINKSTQNWLFTQDLLEPWSKADDAYQNQNIALL